MKKWGYRVVRRNYCEDPSDDRYLIHIVTLNPDGTIVSVDPNPAAPEGLTVGDLQTDLRNMEEALMFPVLDYDEWL